MQVGLSGPSALTYGTLQETGRAELCTHLGVAGPTMQQLLGRECMDTQVHTAHTRAHGAHTLSLSSALTLMWTLSIPSFAENTLLQRRAIHLFMFRTAGHKLVALGS